MNSVDYWSEHYQITVQHSTNKESSDGQTPSVRCSIGDKKICHHFAVELV